MQFGSVDWRKLAACFALCFAVAAIGGFFTAPSVASWYAGLVKPAFTPPSWLFGPVWTILYALMAIALYLVWTAPKRAPLAIPVFIVQLALNLAWSLVFFGLHQPFYALAVILFLEASILACIMLFYKTSRTAALIMVPYALWVAFATLLNYSIWTLN